MRKSSVKRCTLMPPAVEAEHPPTAIRSSSSIWEKAGHCPKSVLAKAVVLDTDTV